MLAFMANIDRSRALELGLDAQAIASDLNTSLSSSEQVTPISGRIRPTRDSLLHRLQTPEHLLNSLGEISNTPVSTAIAAAGPPIPGLLSNVATLKRDSVRTDQTNIQPVYDICFQRTGPRSRRRSPGDVEKIVLGAAEAAEPGLHPGRWPSRGACDSFRDLGIGLLFTRRFAGLLPDGGELSGGRPAGGDHSAAGHALRHSHDAVHHRNMTLSVPSLMGAIMAVGVASANSILLVTFAHEQPTTRRVPGDRSGGDGCARC